MRTKQLVINNSGEWSRLGEITKISFWVVVGAMAVWLFATTFLGEGENVFLAFLVEGVKRQPTIELVVFGSAVIVFARVVFNAYRRDRQERQGRVMRGTA